MFQNTGFIQSTSTPPKLHLFAHFWRILAVSSTAKIAMSNIATWFPPALKRFPNDWIIWRISNIKEISSGHDILVWVNKHKRVCQILQVVMHCATLSVDDVTLSTLWLKMVLSVFKSIKSKPMAEYLLTLFLYFGSNYCSLRLTHYYNLLITNIINTFSQFV